jgi:hypothetical protein
VEVQIHVFLASAPDGSELSVPNTGEDNNINDCSEKKILKEISTSMLCGTNSGSSSGIVTVLKRRCASIQLKV